MPRPILKTLSSYASPQPNTASKSDKRRVALRRYTEGTRRVTFSPFTKPRVISSTPHCTETNHSLTSGFTFSGAPAAEKKIQSRRRKELQSIHTLYRASKRSPHSIKSLLLKNVPGLKQIYTCAIDWLKCGKRIRDAIFRHRYSQSKRLPKMLYRGSWTELDDADHQYVHQLTVASTSSPTAKLQVSSATVDTYPLSNFYRLSQPDLTPANQGHFITLLKKEGILVDEAECQSHQVIDDDLRGLSLSANRQR